MQFPYTWQPECSFLSMNPRSTFLWGKEAFSHTTPFNNWSPGCVSEIMDTSWTNHLLIRCFSKVKGLQREVHGVQWMWKWSVGYWGKIIVLKYILYYFIYTCINAYVLYKYLYFYNLNLKFLILCIFYNVHVFLYIYNTFICRYTCLFIYFKIVGVWSRLH